MDEAGSHVPILCKAFENCDGPVLEMGSGLYSTAILDMLCRQRKKRRILTLENDPEWFEKAHAKYQSDYHDVVFVEDWDDAPIDDTFWSLALIDHRPARRRHVDMIRLKHQAYYVMAHDSELEDHRAYRYDKAYPHFKYRFDYKETLPNTVVLSNFWEMKELRCPR